MKRKLKFLVAFTIITLLTLRYSNAFFIYLENEKPSESIGEVNNGRLKNGKRLPMYGENFRCCSWLLATLGRNAVNHRVKSCMLETYRELAVSMPEAQFVYGETGWPRGGVFWPHKTHQNGLSVDFMVPVKNGQGKTIDFSTHIFNRWGYAVEFDKNGKTNKYNIDFEATAAHLSILEKNARKHGLKIVRVILDVSFHPLLFKTKHGTNLGKRMHFPVWKPIVRHDEHYHVDFEVVK